MRKCLRIELCPMVLVASLSRNVLRSYWERSKYFRRGLLVKLNVSFVNIISVISRQDDKEVN